ncbi:ABC transporter permease [Spongiactinospora gelatinilytica]|uniref:ABC transporter permease n=1 Tax=Spongiactinospora gelatinilytica TaxID=2666298 RepID=A0A2W2GCD9_9ACTN|nr:ABC transporter permease [Spongiactinospora gelatinilytica]PZG47356.1 ABC transporter permease [Spongiactinospora gelatinilytica]
MTAARALAAELSKLLSLPATWLTIAGTLAANLLLAVAFAQAALRGTAATRDVVDVGLASIGYAQAGFVVLGVLAACSEYIGGQIRTTLAAMPHRARQLAAKHLATAIVALPAAALTAFCGVALTALVLGDTPATFGPILGVTGYLLLTTLIGVAAGALARRTLVAVAVLLGYFFVAGPLLRDNLDLAKYLPDTAGAAMWFPAGGALTPAQGALVLTAWTAALIAVALAGHHRRDA